MGVTLVAKTFREVVTIFMATYRRLTISALDVVACRTLTLGVVCSVLVGAAIYLSDFLFMFLSFFTNLLFSRLLYLHSINVFLIALLF